MASEEARKARERWWAGKTAFPRNPKTHPFMWDSYERGFDDGVAALREALERAEMKTDCRRFNGWCAPDIECQIDSEPSCLYHSGGSISHG